MRPKNLYEKKDLNIFIQFIVHIYLLNHDMKVRHRPVLDSGRRQIERHVCAVLQISYATVPGRRKKIVFVR